MANVARAGISPGLFFTALVLPHGILEIPALIMIGAGILQLGAVLLAPAKGKTISEAWLYALADCVKVLLGLIFPLMIGASALEVLVTPRIAVLLLGS